jgi:hypothetical protein
MLASESGLGEMFHALIIIEMIGFKGSAKEPWGTTRVIMHWVVAASAVRPNPPFQGHGRDCTKQYRVDLVTPAPIKALESCFRTEGKTL